MMPCPDVCTKRALQSDPTEALPEVSLSLAESLENPSHSKFGLERETPPQMAALQLSFRLGFSCSFLHYPQVQTRLPAKNQVPEVERS